MKVWDRGTFGFRSKFEVMDSLGQNCPISYDLVKAFGRTVWTLERYMQAYPKSNSIIISDPCWREIHGPLLHGSSVGSTVDLGLSRELHWIVYQAALYDDKLPTGCKVCINDFSMGHSKQLWRQSTLNKESKPSLGSRPLVLHRFPALTLYQCCQW